MQPACYLQSAARWYSCALQPAAAMRSSCCAKSKLPAIELSSDCSVLYFQDSHCILTVILSCTDLSALLWTSKSTEP